MLLPIAISQSVLMRPIDLREVCLWSIRDTRLACSWKRPLDFLVVSDHAEFLGNIRHLYNVGLPTDGLGLFDKLRVWYVQYLIRDAIKKGEGRAFFVQQLPEPFDTPQEAISEWDLAGSVFPRIPAIEDQAWSDIADAAEANNVPGQFSAILGWEYSLIPGGANLHRVVMTDLDGESAKVFQPFRV
jgi:hypothetical protein